MQERHQWLRQKRNGLNQTQLNEQLNIWLATLFETEGLKKNIYALCVV